MHLRKKLRGGEGITPPAEPIQFERSNSQEAFADGRKAYGKGKGPDDCPSRFKHVEDSWLKGFASAVHEGMVSD